MRAARLLSILALGGSPTMGFELWLDLRTGALPPGAPCSPAELAAFDRQLLTPEQSSAPVEGPSQIIVEPSCKLVDGARNLVGAAVAVGSANAQNEALALVGSVQWLFVDATGGAPMITAENVLAAAESTGTLLATTVGAASEVNGLTFALERGVDALVVSAPLLAGDEGAELFEALQIAKAQRLERSAAAGAEGGGAGGTADDVEALIGATVTAVANGGVADRVCIDLTRLLREGEGCLLGSSAKLLALVLGETIPSGYVPPRPFRVNAGPVHQYVLMARPAGATKYLSEVEAGDAVLVVDSLSGRSRGVTVGRAKTEPRPMLRIDLALADGEEEEVTTGQLFLQQAETVRLATLEAGGAAGALPVTVAATASNLPQVRVRTSVMGTHVGRAIKARVNER